MKFNYKKYYWFDDGFEGVVTFHNDFDFTLVKKNKHNQNLNRKAQTFTLIESVDSFLPACKIIKIIYGLKI